MLMKRICYLLTFLIILVSSGYNACAGEDTPGETGTHLPKVKLYSESTIDIQNGENKNFLLEVKNVGTGRADNLFVQAVPGPEDPFTLSTYIMGGSTSMQAGVSKLVQLSVSVESGAEGKVYPVTLNYSYISADGQIYTESDVLNIRVTNNKSAANIRLYNFELTPASLSPGETGVLSFNYMNMGAVIENNVRISLEGLDSSAITIPNGLNSQVFTAVRPYEEEKASFDIKASSSCKAGVYPITITTTVRSGQGEPATDQLQYFISVGGGGATTGDAILEVVGKTAPTGVYSPGESFNISFTLSNTSGFDANNLFVKAVTEEGSVIVPTSQSMIMTRTLAAGESQDYNFTFAATSEAKTQNYPISFTIEYDSGLNDETKINFSQFFGVNITNPEKEEEEEEEDDKEKNKPKIIVSSYTCEPVIVKAGEEFELNMTFLNTHAQKAVKNIKVSLTVTDKDDNVGASIFSPVNASNTLYIESIAPRQTETRSIRYYAIPDANPQTYSINVNFEYEDPAGVAMEAHEIVGINVSQPPVISTSEINLPVAGDVGVPMFINFEIFNTGNVDVRNLKVVLEGDMQSDSGKTMWFGNFEQGSNEYVEAVFYYLEPGVHEGRLVISYDSPTGEHFEMPNELSITVNEPPPVDFDMPPDMPIDDPGFSATSRTLYLVAAGIAAVVLITAGFFIYRHFKKKRKQADDDFFV